MASALRDRLKAASFKLFLLGDRAGVHILPKHYYTPVPDMTWLRAHPEAWMGPVKFDHVDWDLDRQLEWTRSMCAPYYPEVQGWAVFKNAARVAAGPGYGPVESQVLHCVIRTLAPQRIVEVGSGMSTLCMLHAGSLNERDGKRRPAVTCIEPFPRPALRARTDIRLEAAPLQLVNSSIFRALAPGDLLFIDSSHALKVGSDVARLYVDVIPNLAPGVIVHIHDIYFPYLYGPDAMRSYFGWQESTLLLALLTDNPRLRVLGCLSALHHDRPEELQAILGDYVPAPLENGLEGPGGIGDRHFPSSIYLAVAEG